MREVNEGPHSADVRHYSEGIQFPALKHDVVHAFRASGAPNEVVARVQTLPVTEFTDLDQLQREYDAARDLGSRG